MPVSLDECGGYVFIATLSERGLRQIRTYGTQGLLEDGYFVFNVAATSTGAVGRATRRLISPTGFHINETVVRY